MENTKNIGDDETGSVAEAPEPKPSVAAEQVQTETPQATELEVKEPTPVTEPVTPEKIESEVQTIVDNMLTFMGIKAMVRSKLTDDGYYVNIRSRNSDGLLIGKRGMTALSVQSIVNQIMRHRYPNIPIDVFIDVSGYRKRRENFLKKKALAVAKVVIETKRDMALDILTEREFRMIENELASFATVRVYAIGTGAKKTVIIAPL